MDLQGQVALVTGGGIRVGRAIALGLAGAGAHLMVHYHTSAGPAEDTAAEARRLGVKAVTVQADLTDPLRARTLAATTLDRFGRVDILVHGASPFVGGSLYGVDLAAWRKLMGVLVESFLVLVQELAPSMTERGQGAIVALLDRGAFDPWPDHLAHSVGKAALWALVRTLAVELAPQVRVNALVPGPVLAPPEISEKNLARLASQTLMRRWGTPQDVVDAVLFLVRSGYITGEALLVDGGQQWAHNRPTRLDPQAAGSGAARENV